MPVPGVSCALAARASPSCASFLRYRMYRAAGGRARDTMCCSPLQGLFFLAGLLLRWRPGSVTQCSFCSLLAGLPSHLHPTPAALAEPSGPRCDRPQPWLSPAVTVPSSDCPQL